MAFDGWRMSMICSIVSGLLAADARVCPVSRLAMTVAPISASGMSAAKNGFMQRSITIGGSLRSVRFLCECGLMGTFVSD